jgi:hypothetical protein
MDFTGNITERDGIRRDGLHNFFWRQSAIGFISPAQAFHEINNPPFPPAEKLPDNTERAWNHGSDS